MDPYDDHNNEYSSQKNQRRNNLNKKKKFFESSNKFYKGKPSELNTNKRSNAMIDIYFDTVTYFNNKKLAIKEPSLYDIGFLPIKDKDLETLLTYNTVYVVKNQDTFDMALDFIKEGFVRPLVLNMASEYKPGGGVASGKTAQEECLFRRSNAFQTHPNNWYPLEENQVIYSPEVQINKDSDYDMLPESVIDTAFVSMLAVAAIRKPRLNHGEYYDEDRELMTKKIESIFKIALMHGHDSLVLGALGCGVFRNPPESVANIYKLCTNLYGKYFKKIGFAILAVKEADQENIIMFNKKF